MRKKLGYFFAFVAIGLLVFIALIIGYATYYGQNLVSRDTIHWIGQIAIFCCVVAAWAFWEI